MMKTLMLALGATSLFALAAPAVAQSAKADAAMARKCALPANTRNAKCVAFKKAHAAAAAQGDAMMSSDGAMKKDDAMMSSGDQMKSDKPK